MPWGAGWIRGAVGAGTLWLISYGQGAGGAQCDPLDLGLHFGLHLGLDLGLDFQLVTQ